MFFLVTRSPVQNVRVDHVDLVEGPPRHPVTEKMMAETAEKAKKVAPGFTLKDTEGKEVTIGSPSAPRPQFVYFVLDGCPCSFDAEPLFQKLSRRYQGKVDFVAVTNAGQTKAHQWHTQMLVPYSVVPDPKLEVIKAYEAVSSVYSALVTKDGKIEKMWPGYSQDILKEMNAEFAKISGVKEEPFDPEFAPKERATGCAF